MKKRLFLAIQLPKDTVSSLAQIASSPPTAIGGGLGIRWTAIENLHITVYFLGYVDERDTPVVTERIKNALDHFKPFELEFKQIEFAPPNRPARMIWAVFSDKKGEYKNFVDSLFNELKDFCARDFRGKEAVAHVTLVRFREPSIARRVPLHQPDIKEKVFKVSSCDLMESRLSREGPAYTVLKSFQFGKLI